MKAIFITPSIKIVDLGDSITCDLVSASTEIEIGEGDGDPNEARFRNNPIWDDYE